MLIKRTICLLILLSGHLVFAGIAEKVDFIRNSNQEIEACRGKMQLKLIRTWGGAEEQDENKFFDTPSDVLTDSENRVYICDLYNHHIKVFDRSGNYVKTIGTRGRGPGDLYGPKKIALSSIGDLWVGEQAGRRMQCFSETGKSKEIFKIKTFIWSVGVTSKNEVIIYAPKITFESKRLLAVYNSNGKFSRYIGVYHAISNNPFMGEKIRFVVDQDDYVYVANGWVPVIRKYSAGGRLKRVVTFETPFDIPVKVQLNEKGDEIVRLNDYGQQNIKTENKTSGVAIQIKKSKEKKYGVGVAMAIDEQKNIYQVSLRRVLTKEESKGTMISGNANKLNRSLLNYDVVENIDVNRVLVFNPQGKIIAAAPLTTFCDGIYVKGDRLFVVDGMFNQRVLEYRMIFKD